MVVKGMRSQAYVAIREKIVNCVYPPGTMLNEAMLTQELEFSRTPIRDALTRIEQEGFIEILPKKGIYVKNVSLKDVRQIFKVRLEIEPLALKMAGPSLPKESLFKYRDLFSGSEISVEADFRVDQQMHLFIIDHCGNRFIIDMMHKVFDENTRVIISSGQNEAKIHDARKEHLAIINYLIDENYDLAEEAMKFHINQCKEKALDFFYNV
ncbi:GntR family transcriptional regulator, partial [Spirochaeta cellobiosiphila]|uniref:GntR family transcriptional regulator n=1 Tax=Spirochaeta cellobiosiphila TaxID=504483 RepID=UPI000401B9CA